MARIVKHYASLTAGTKISGDTSGFIVPRGMKGIGHMWKSGALGQHLDVTFSAEGHVFSLEQIYCGGEIAVNTREMDTWHKAIWCGWRLPELTRVDITPRGNESSTAGVIFVEWIDGTESRYAGKLPLHWMHGTDALGTYATGSKIIDLPREARKVIEGLAIGAGLEVAQYTVEPAGKVFSLVGTDLAEFTGETPTMPTYIDTPVLSDQIQWFEDSNNYTGTAAVHLYFAVSY